MHADDGRCDGDGWAFAPIRRRGKTARPRGVQQRPAAAEMIRASVKNRVANEGPGASVAIHGRRRSERARAILRTVACRGANSRPPQPPPSHRPGAAVHRTGLGDGDVFAA
jgi:hypothetical protein